MKRLSVLAAMVFVLSLPFASGQPVVATNVSFNAPPPPIVARVYANPAKYRGHCPATITFNGEISAPPPGRRCHTSMEVKDSKWLTRRSSGAGPSARRPRDGVWWV